MNRYLTDIIKQFAKVALMFPVFILLILTGCSESEVCPGLPQSDLNAGFYTLIEGAAKDSAVPITSVIANNSEESILFETEEYSQSIFFTLDPAHDSCSVYLHFMWADSVLVADDIYEVFTQEATDEIVFKYGRNLWFESIECGFLYQFELEEIDWTENYISNIEIVRSNVSDAPYENIKIYF